VVCEGAVPQGERGGFKARERRMAARRGETRGQPQHRALCMALHTLLPETLTEGLVTLTVRRARIGIDRVGDPLPCRPRCSRMRRHCLVVFASVSARVNGRSQAEGASAAHKRASQRYARADGCGSGRGARCVCTVQCAIDMQRGWCRALMSLSGISMGLLTRRITRQFSHPRDCWSGPGHHAAEGTRTGRHATCMITRDGHDPARAVP